MRRGCDPDHLVYKKGRPFVRYTASTTNEDILLVLPRRQLWIFLPVEKNKIFDANTKNDRGIPSDWELWNDMDFGK